MKDVEWLTKDVRQRERIKDTYSMGEGWKERKIYKDRMHKHSSKVRNITHTHTHIYIYYKYILFLTYTH